MGELWLGYCAEEERMELARALRAVEPRSVLVFARDAADLRAQLHDEPPGEVGAIVGLTREGVSDMNLAAALVHDGYASEVLLVSRGASGSLRSRAARAGISRVLDLAGEGSERRGLHARPAGPLEQTRPPAHAETRPASTASAAPPRHRSASSAPMPNSSPGKGVGGGVAEAGVWDSRASTRQAFSSEPTTRLDREATTRLSREVPRVPAMDAPVGAPTPQGWRESANQARGSSTASLSTSGRAPVLTLASGRGGVGKTAIAALLAAKAAQWGMSVALVDLDLSCGNLGSLFGVRRTADLARLGASGDSDLETMGRCNVRCANNLLLWGPCERPELAETVMPHVGPLLDYLSCRYDLVVVDTSTTFTEAVALAAQRADRLMLVYVGGDEALGRLGRTSALAVRLGVARTRIVRVENLADPRVRRGRDEEPGELRLDAARPARVLDGYEEAAELLESGGADELARSSSACASSTAALLARTLSELGCLPDVEEARRLARPERGKRRLSLFSKRREVRS